MFSDHFIQKMRSITGVWKLAVDEPACLQANLTLNDIVAYYLEADIMQFGCCFIFNQHFCLIENIEHYAEIVCRSEWLILITKLY